MLCLPLAGDDAPIDKKKNFCILIETVRKLIFYPHLLPPYIGFDPGPEAA